MAMMEEEVVSESSSPAPAPPRPSDEGRRTGRRRRSRPRCSTLWSNNNHHRRLPLLIFCCVVALAVTVAASVVSSSAEEESSPRLRGRGAEGDGAAASPATATFSVGAADPSGRPLHDDDGWRDSPGENKKRRKVLIVDLRDHFVPHTTKIAVQACAGLYNRDDDGNGQHHDDDTQQGDEAAPLPLLPLVYTLLNSPEDEHWMRELKIDQRYIPRVPFLHRHYLTANEFLEKCLARFPRRIRYRYYGPHRRVVPNVLTLGSILNAVPLQDSDPIFDGMEDGQQEIEIAFDALTHPSFVTNDAPVATGWVYDTYANRTTAMAKLNPGYDTAALPTLIDEREPPLVGDLDVGIIDLVYSQRLFAFYMYYGCAPGPMRHIWETPAHRLVDRMSKDRAGGKWDRPVPVYGYDDSWNVGGGDVFEAETLCVGSHDMGQIATEGVNNLSFLGRYSDEVKPGEIDLGPRRIAIEDRSWSNAGGAPMEKEEFSPINHDRERPQLADDEHPPPTTITRHDPTKVYVALVIGDGDNINFVKSTRSDWMRERVERCKKSDGEPIKNKCFPVSWTMSPWTARLAPDLLRWYVRQAKDVAAAAAAAEGSAAGGADDGALDTFVLPPSGHLYAYPAMMPPDVQSDFVTATELDAVLLNTTGVVDWEWFTTWNEAFDEFYPRYARNGVVRGVFAVNVPYLVPTAKFLPNEFFRIVHPPPKKGPTGGSQQHPVVVFRPREWRGVASERSCAASTPAIPAEDFKTPRGMADELASHPRGTVTYLYLTSDGGLDFGHVAELASVLPDHVEVVSTETATALALASASSASTSEAVADMDTDTATVA